jgi:inhibitor of cysteine peptidase
MYKKITLTLIVLILLASLAGCGSTAKENSSSSSGETQNNQTANTTLETNPQDNQQLLPIISGREVALRLDATADGTTQQLTVGQVLAITLESNPSTGYGWFVGQVDTAILTQLGDPQYQEPQSSGTTPIVGAAGTETYYFQAAATGTTTLTLEYKRGWETGVAPEKTITLTVEVK